MDTTYKNPNANYFDLGQGGNPITMDSLTPKTPITLTPTPQDTTNYSGVIQSVPDYTDILKGMQATTPQETVVNQERGRLQKITDYILGKGGSVGSDGKINTDIAKNNALETNIKNFGYSDSGDAYKQLTEVNSQINALRKEALAIPLQVQNELTGRASVSGMQGQSEMRLRQNAIKSLGLASIAETIQGNISTASSLAERAVNMEFAPIQAELNAFRQNYELNKDALERADKKKAQQLEFTLKERERVLNDQMADKKTILGFVAEGAKNGAPTLLLDRASRVSDPSEAVSILSEYMSNPDEKANAILDRKYKQAQINKIYSDIELSKEELKNKYSGVSGKPLTDAQATSLGYANRLAEASVIIDEIGKQFTGASSYLGKFAPNLLKTEDRQRYEQAQRNFVNAVLRKESGAVISDEEFNNAKQQYFPQPGDSSGVLEQKKQNRNTVYQNFLRNAGNPVGANNYDPYSSERGQLKTGEILIERNGQVGAIPLNEFNSKTDKKL